ncbi:hypothetical protein llap_10351 [Limosa lapponica baueri]|uniref:Uncharacterized protein n=1 Tax=Limosa lapponica baueri TaxID=1758121 RepID=A0A2I0TZV6_LIMLA|nr:hypothetical protein llap_10351 [Limosa lapponica baueri]
MQMAEVRDSLVRVSACVYVYGSLSANNWSHTMDHRIHVSVMWQLETRVDFGASIWTETLAVGDPMSVVAAAGTGVGLSASS